jgi:hypothetical protein
VDFGSKEQKEFQAYITASLELIHILNFWEVSDIVNSHVASGTQIVVGQQQYFPHLFRNGNGEHEPLSLRIDGSLIMSFAVVVPTTIFSTSPFVPQFVYLLSDF